MRSRTGGRSRHGKPDWPVAAEFRQAEARLAADFETALARPFWQWLPVFIARLVEVDGGKSWIIPFRVRFVEASGK
jgi:hypothetical protein